MNGLGKPKIDEVQTVVAELFGLEKADMKSACRRRSVAHPRQAAMYLARELTGRSYPEIGLRFGKRDHTTVLFAYRKVSELVKTDAALAASLDACRAKLAQLVSGRVGALVTMKGSSTPWHPPAPTRVRMALLKPDFVVASINDAAWLACDA